MVPVSYFEGFSIRGDAHTFSVVGGLCMCVGLPWLKNDGTYRTHTLLSNERDNGLCQLIAGSGSPIHTLCTTKHCALS